MRKITLIVFLAFSCLLLGQNTISGIVLDEHLHPVYNASVYINGTTIGMSSDSAGAFVLKNVNFPCQLVVAHINYEITALDIQKTSSVTVNLKKDERCIPEINVDGTSNRKKNLRMFSTTFLGEDVWGEGAKLRNDSDLIFTKVIDTVTITVNKGNINEYHYDEYETTLKARAKVPLIVDLPLLGYTLSFYLIDFSMTTRYDSRTSFSYLGYRHFKPYTPKNNLQKMKFNINRKTVYYYSTFHFYNSLYTNTLHENGYLFLEQQKKSDKNKESSYYVKEITVLQDSVSDNKAFVLGQNENKYILIYEENNGKPKDWTSQSDIMSEVYYKEDYNKYLTSDISFLSDTCVFYKNGIVPNKDIFIKGSLLDKRVGASLPSDYCPDPE